MKKAKKRATPWTLVVEYKADGPDGRDAAIEKAVGRERDGSGYTFVSGVRDLHFYFAQQRSVESAKQRIKDALGRRVKTIISSIRVSR
jgi:hypothetical protein